MSEPFISIEGGELTAWQLKVISWIPAVRKRIWIEVRKSAFDAEARVKQRMPVDTGRARASWGHGAPPALPEDSIWQENEEALMITEGTRVNYVQYLEEGSSRQAPAGFIAAVSEAVSDALAQAIADVVSEVKNAGYSNFD